MSYGIMNIISIKKHYKSWLSGKYKFYKHLNHLAYKHESFRFKIIKLLKKYLLKI